MKEIIIKKKKKTFNAKNKSELLEGKRQTIKSGDWLREVVEMGTE